MQPSPLIEEAVSRYIAAWNEHDPQRRASLLAQCLTEDVRLAVEGQVIRGRAAVEAEIVGFQRELPAARGRVSTVVDQHGSVCRFGAVVEGADGASVAEMLDVCECDDSGRFRWIVTFAGALPSAPSDPSRPSSDAHPTSV